MGQNPNLCRTFRMYRAEWRVSRNGQSLISNSWGMKARLQVFITFPFMCCQRWVGTGGMISIAGLAPLSWYTPLSSVHSWNLYIGLVFDQILKANFKINTNYEIMRINLATKPNKIGHHSATYCVNLSRFTLRLFELFTIKSVNKN